MNEPYEDSIRVCLIGPTGSGKSTIARYLMRHFGAELIKIAQPLYELQDEFYKRLGKSIDGQDGELLQFLGQKIERESPGWLAQRFLRKVRASASRMIVNDDCRPHSYQALRAAGFVFIRVKTEQRIRSARARADHVAIDSDHPVEQGFDELHCNFEIDNGGDFSATKHQIEAVIGKFFWGHSGWLTGHQIVTEYHRGRIAIEPYDPDRLNANSYNYLISPILHRISSSVIDLRKPDEFEAITMDEEGYELQPFELYLGSTVERFGSDYFAALITGRSSIGRKFVTNHVTAGLIDQGFFGNITLEIVVHKPTRIYPNMKFGQIFWFSTMGPPQLYNGRYQSQAGPTGSKLHEDDSDGG